MTAGRRIRQRQDLRTVPQFERELNDVGARDAYEQLLLDSIRAGTNPNDKAVVEVYEGYVEPHYDAVHGRQVMHQHREAMRQLFGEREVILRTLRASAEHQSKSPFEQLLLETEFYTGIREWGGSASSTNNNNNRREVRSSQNSQLMDREDSSTGTDTMLHLTTTPAYIRGSLRAYQLEGVNWLLGLFSKGINGILADEMGLGKTFQTIATLAYLKFTVGMPGPHLVVCPKSVMGNWFREFKHWCPALAVYKYHAPSHIRPGLLKAHLNPSEGIKYDVIVTTFEMILDDLNAFRKIDWQYLIVDEAHKLKNDESRAHSALASLPTLHRLIITGTPLQNNLKELWALLHFLAPRLFHDSTTFDTWFDTASGQQDAQVMSDLHKMLAPLMIRRLKADVSTGIPPKKEVYVSCKLTKKQREWYMHVLANDAEALNKTSSGSTARLSNILMHLRKVINHPYLMDGGEDGPPFITDEKLVRSSGKMIILDKLLHRLRNDVEGQHKVLIFSQFTMMLDVLEDYCNMRGFKYCRIDGNTSAYDRDSRMANFNAPGSDSFLFLLSTRAGGLGINLQAANHVILYDSDWNPQMDLQAQDRAHRIGQKRRVRVYRFVTDGTVEERVYYRALKKLYLDAMVVQQGRIQSRSTSAASKEELLSMIKFGAEEIFQSRQDDVTEADIDKLLEAGEAKSAELTTEAQKTVQASLASFQLGAEEGNIYDFEGISFRGGVETRVLHMELPQPVSQAQLHAECSAYGEAIKVVLHPNLKEALVHFRSTAGAVEAKSGLPYKCTFVGRENQAVVSSEMIAECLGAGEKLGRGHRHREVRVYADEEVERLQNRAPKAPPLKLPKAPKFKFHQLFNMKRLMELHNTEVALLVRAWKRRYEVSNNTTTSANPDDATGRGGEGQENAASPVEPGSPGSPGQASTAGDEEDEGLTEVEQEERERLLSEGFEHWTYREYRTIISALCSGDVGVTDYAALTKLVATAAEADDATPKTVGEVKDYLGALMERGERYIPNFGHLESRINKAQARHKLLEDTLRHARQKVETCELPERNLNVKVKGFTPLDRRLFLIGYDAGFAAGCCEQVARNLPELRFNVWAQSRGEGHYDRRLVTLMRAAYREVESAGDASMPPTSRRRREAA